jgi:hypothetical protein
MKKGGVIETRDWSLVMCQFSTAGCFPAVRALTVGKLLENIIL